MFQNFHREQGAAVRSSPLSSSFNKRVVTKNNNNSNNKGVAGPTPFHRRSSWLLHDRAAAPYVFFQKWHFYDNNGSYNGWFDWLPIRMRVGYFSPVACVAILMFYASVYWYKPRPQLQFEIVEESVAQDDFWWKMDCAVFFWGLFVIAYAKATMGTIGAFYISYTGWSWMILTARGGLEASSQTSLVLSNRPELAVTLAKWGSALRFPAAVAAFITFTVWNFVLLPIIYFIATPPGKKRRNFAKFNSGFFMMNIHVLNLPIAMANIIYGGSGVRIFTISDLWVGYLVVALYSALYIFVMDRLGLHFYPIFCPRTAWCAVSFGVVLFLYWDLMHRGNALILYLNPDIISA